VTGVGVFDAKLTTLQTGVAPNNIKLHPAQWPRMLQRRKVRTKWRGYRQGF
jgi:hypothetical protein